jgi:hypothetical protein
MKALLYHGCQQRQMKEAKMSPIESNKGTSSGDYLVVQVSKIACYIQANGI